MGRQVSDAIGLRKNLQECKKKGDMERNGRERKKKTLGERENNRELEKKKKEGSKMFTGHKECVCKGRNEHIKIHEQSPGSGG